MTERHSERVAVFILLERDGQVFLLRRENTGYQDGKWSVPAGHVEAGESLAQAALREAAEEAGVEADIGDVEFLLLLHRGSPEAYVDAYFRLRSWRGEPRNREPEKASDAGWFSRGELPSPLVPHVEAGLRLVAEGKAYGECGWQE